MRFITFIIMSYMVSSTVLARSVYLNGIDISGAQGQDLKKVDIRINEKGDIFISAPHYQVNEEDTYIPLSQYVEGVNAPKHKPPASAGASMFKVGKTVPVKSGDSQKVATDVSAEAPETEIEMGEPEHQEPKKIEAAQKSD